LAFPIIGSGVVGAGLTKLFYPGAGFKKTPGMKFLPRLMLWLVLACSASVPAETLRLVANTWPPFNDVNLLNNGLSSDLVITALKRAGYSSSYFQVPWARVLYGVQVGDYDIVVSAWYDAERATYGVFSQPYLINRIRFLRRKGTDTQFRSLSDLGPASIAVVRGYSYQPAFDADQQLLKVPVVDFAMGARMLAAGRVQLTLEDELVARHYFQYELQGIEPQLEFLPKPLSENGLHILVRNSHPQAKEIVERFNRAMQAMRDDGTYEKIFAAHGFASATEVSGPTGQDPGQIPD
jgi:polar amino acid transport system substrate-binding protein